jgi:hypothetical protein
MDTGQRRFSACAVAGDWAIVQMPTYQSGYLVEKVRRERVTCRPWGAGPSIDVPGDSPTRPGEQGDAACWIVVPLAARAPLVGPAMPEVVGAEVPRGNTRTSAPGRRERLHW